MFRVKVERFRAGCISMLIIFLLVSTVIVQRNASTLNVVKYHPVSYTMQDYRYLKKQSWLSQIVKTPLEKILIAQKCTTLEIILLFEIFFVTNSNSDVNQDGDRKWDTLYIKIKGDWKNKLRKTDTVHSVEKLGSKSQTRSNLFQNVVRNEFVSSVNNRTISLLPITRWLVSSETDTTCE